VRFVRAIDASMSGRSVHDVRRVAQPPARPLLIFDGDCGVCRFWVARFRVRSGEAVDYEPFQTPEITPRFPEIQRERFVHAVHLIEPDGRVSDGAEAVFRLLSVGGPDLGVARRTWSRVALVAYDHIPGARAISERAYRLVADHRPLFARLTTLCWGRVTRRPTYALASWVFLRLLGLVYLIAFVSLATQIVGLVGHDGILPASLYMDQTRRVLADVGLDRFRLLPTLTWFSASDVFLRGLCWSGAATALMVIAGVLPAVALPLLWLLYLSLSIVSRDFLSYQWDALLLETGVLAMFVAPPTLRHRLRDCVDPPRLSVWLLWWLLFRLMFGSGAVKLASGDPAWRGLTALTFHFWTQPLPTPIAWYADRLPAGWLKTSTAAVLAIELIAPLAMLGPRRMRSLACGLFVGLQTLIALTGNYAFFNVLTVSLCLFLLDDATLERFMAPAASATVPRNGSGAVRRLAVRIVALVTVPVSLFLFMGSLGIELPGWVFVAPLAAIVEPFRSVNTYGLFAVMTTARPEIIVEGSDDGTVWKAYDFKDKPTDVHQTPPWVAPHQPRLDWQMWFAALGHYDSEIWFRSFCVRLLQGSPDVLRLLQRDPFGGRPPRYIRARLYQYHFADAATRHTAGVWWTRERVGDYSPVLSLH
jgi:predicted DCC family thiol-disulfide oxidoreductase YuxK